MVRPAEGCVRGCWVGILLLTGCVRGTVDRYTTQSVIPRALAVPDVDRACQVGAALGHPLAGMTAADRPADRALIIADATAALCAEPVAREAELAAGIALFSATGPARVATVKDERERERRARELAALRFASAFARTERVFGPIGVDATCPRIREQDELTLLVGLVSGTLAMLHDKASGGAQGVPLDTLARVGRAASCLDDERWWHVPAALSATAWAVVPGSGPEGVDAWAALEQAARAGEGSGVRLGWALYAQISGNAGQDERTALAVHGFASSLASTPSDPAHALFDRYAFEVVRHQSDLLWVAAAGHRTQVFGELPTPAAEPAPTDVPPAGIEDPFAPDPFAEETP